MMPYKPLGVLVLTVQLTVAGLPVPAAWAAEENISDSLVSMEFDGAPLRDVLKIFSEQSGLNFVASQEVESKKVTVFLENVPARDALEGIMNANNLRYERKPGSNVYIVNPIAEGGAETGAAGPAVPLQTRIFPIRHSRLSVSAIDVGGKSVIDDLPGIEVNALKTGDSGGEDEGSKDEDKKSGEEKTNLMAERGIDKIVASLLTEFGHIAVDLPSNSLIVTDTAPKLQEIEKVLQKLDVPATQVMIEVQMMEVRKGLLEDHGIDWGGANGALVSWVPGRQSTSFPFRESFIRRQSANQILDPITGDLGRRTMELGIIDAGAIEAVLRLISSQTDTKILARPRVLTMNNEAANINIVTKTVIGEKSTLVSSQSLTTFTTGEAVTADTGITLKMTPQVNQDETISLWLQPSITTVQVSNFFPTRFLEPTTRTVRSTVRVKNHQTLVIGGLIDTDRSVTNRKIPVLGDLPLLGPALFNYKDNGENEREFLVFITPHIVKRYDSLAEESATVGSGRDLAVKRMLDQFAGDELTLMMSPAEALKSDRHPLDRQEKALLRASAKQAAASPSAEKEMNRTLDAFGKK